MSNMILITKRTSTKGAYEYKTFSVRIKNDIIKKIDEISVKTNRSRNEIISIFLEYGVNNSILSDKSE